MARWFEPKPRVCFEFEVEKVTGVSSEGNYQVQWAPSWVSKFHLVGCEHLIEEFLQSQAVGETENHQSPCVLNGSSPSSGECEQHFLRQQSELELKIEPELHHTSNEIEDNVPRMHDFLQQQPSPKLKIMSGIQLNLPVDGIEEKEKEHSESEQTNIATVLHKSNGPTTLQVFCSEREGGKAPILETHPVNPIEILPRYGSPCTADEENLLSMRNEIVAVSESACRWPGEQPEGQVYDIEDSKPSQCLSNRHDLQIDTAIDISETARSIFHHSHQPHSSLGNNLSPHVTNKKKEFSCTVCEKSFRSPWHLVRHFRMHTGEKPYECSHCNKSFSEKSNLKKHLKSHTRVRLYYCTHCSYSCSRRSSLVVHLHTHSGEKT